MSEKTKEQPQDKLELECQRHRRVIGALLLLASLFPLLSLCTYSWRDISDLNTPPLSPPSNLIGPVGAWSAYIGYHVMGLTLWVVPAFALVFSGLLLYGRIVRVGRRALWMILFLIALCGLVQLGSTTVFDGILEHLNMRPNAGGVIGYWLMTCTLERWLSPVGSCILLIIVMLVSLIMAIGVRTLFDLLGCVTGWWESRRGAGDAPLPDEPEAEAEEDELTPRERRRLEKKAAKEAARTAKEEARAALQAERQRIADEREAERRQQEEARDKLARQPQEREERLRQRIEEAKRAAAADRDRPRAPVPQPQAVVAPPVAEPAVKRREPAPVAPAAAVAQPQSTQPDLADYPLPPIALLNPIPSGSADHGDVDKTAAILVETLKQFGVPVEVVGTTPGPVVTQYELRPAPNVKVERIVALTANLQMALEAHSLRVLAPIPGKNAVGIEIPNRRACPVTFREIVEGAAWRHCKYEIPLALGKDVAGNDLIYDLAKAPHLLVAGSTGSGKSVCLNAILNGFLLSRTPEQLRLILVDPKRVEFTCYNDLPHLLVPVINDPKKVAFGLRWAILEMEKRYKLFQKAGCRNIVAFNSRQAQVAEQVELFGEGGEAVPAAAQDEMPAKLPYIVIVVDEVADIMASVGKEVEPAIAKLTALSRAVGIHLILATQRPSVDVITGTIKANVPGRIAFKVSQTNDSRTILDNPGAEELIGKGDMLFLREGSQLMRAQGAWVNDEEIARVVSFVKEHCRPCYDQALVGRLDKIKESDLEDTLDDGDDDDGGGSGSDIAADEGGVGGGDDEPMLAKALDVIRRTKRASTSMIQRRLGIGYTRAARVMDLLEERGVIGPVNGANAREILIDLDNEIPSNTTDFGEEADDASPEPDEAGLDADEAGDEPA